MHERLIAGVLLVVAAIHLLPLVGVLGVDRLASLYDIRIVDPDLEILMRHRAVLFGILGTFVAVAAFRTEFQVAAIMMAFTSVASFIYLAVSVGAYSTAIRAVVNADLFAAALLIGAIITHLSKR